MSMDSKAFWNRVKSQLREKTITQDAAAKFIGIPAHTFRGWMSKGRIPPLSYAFELSSFLGVSLEYLITGNKSNTKVPGRYAASSVTRKP